VVAGVLALSLLGWIAAAYFLKGGGQRQVARVLPPLHIGDSATPAPTPTPLKLVTRPRTSPTDFQSGLSLLVYAQNPPLGSYAPLLDRLVADDVNSLSIAFPVYTDGLHSNVVHPGANTPTDTALAALVGQAKQRGFTVMLRPLLDEASILPNWRGAIQPASPSAWFASYGALLLSYARIAQRAGADSIGVGSELNSMEPDADGWRGLIAQVRQVFSGEITYSVNWETNPTDFRTGFWSQLDFLSVDAYFPLDRTPAVATVPQMTSDWRRWLDLLDGLDRPFGKPIVFTEVGVAPKLGAHLKPWNQQAGAQLDLDEQSSYYQATCAATTRSINGLYWWAAGPELPGDLSADDYNPLGRPAEAAMQACYAGLPAPQTPPAQPAFGATR
jgi:hypothetical protein